MVRPCVECPFAPVEKSTAPAQPQTARARVDHYLNGVYGGINVERELMYEFSQDEWNYLYKQVPAPMARVFNPWRPQGGFAANEGRAWVMPSDNVLSRFVDGIGKARKAGFPRVFADCTDLCEDGDFGGDGPKLIAQVCDEIARRCAERGYGADWLSIGPINEWACKQELVHKHQDAFVAALRRHLPQHVLSYGPDYWKSFKSLIDNQNYRPAADELSFCDVHGYIGRWENSGFQWLAVELDKWTQRTGRRVVFGEMAGGNLMQDEENHDIYADNLRRQMPILRRHVPLAWAVSKGGHWRLNHNGAEYKNGQAYPTGGNAPRIADALRAGLGL